MDLLKLDRLERQIVDRIRNSYYYLWTLLYMSKYTSLHQCLLTIRNFIEYVIENPDVAKKASIALKYDSLPIYNNSKDIYQKLNELIPESKVPREELLLIAGFENMKIIVRFREYLEGISKLYNFNTDDERFNYILEESFNNKYGVFRFPVSTSVLYLASFLEYLKGVKNPLSLLYHKLTDNLLISLGSYLFRTYYNSRCFYDPPIKHILDKFSNIYDHPEFSFLELDPIMAVIFILTYSNKYDIKRYLWCQENCATYNLLFSLQGNITYRKQSYFKTVVPNFYRKLSEVLQNFLHNYSVTRLDDVLVFFNLEFTNYKLDLLEKVLDIIRNKPDLIKGLGWRHKKFKGFTSKNLSKLVDILKVSIEVAKNIEYKYIFRYIPKNYSSSAKVIMLDSFIPLSYKNKIIKDLKNAINISKHSVYQLILINGMLKNRYSFLKKAWKYQLLQLEKIIFFIKKEYALPEDTDIVYNNAEEIIKDFCRTYSISKEDLDSINLTDDLLYDNRTNQLDILSLAINPVYTSKSKFYSIARNLNIFRIDLKDPLIQEIKSSFSKVVSKLFNMKTFKDRILLRYINNYFDGFLLVDENLPKITRDTIIKHLKKLDIVTNITLKISFNVISNKVGLYKFPLNDKVYVKPLNLLNLVLGESDYESNVIKVNSLPYFEKSTLFFNIRSVFIFKSLFKPFLKTSDLQHGTDYKSTEDAIDLINKILVKLSTSSYLKYYRFIYYPSKIIIKPEYFKDRKNSKHTTFSLLSAIFLTIFTKKKDLIIKQSGYVYPYYNILQILKENLSESDFRWVISKAIQLMEELNFTENNMHKVFKKFLQIDSLNSLIDSFMIEEELS